MTLLFSNNSESITGNDNHLKADKIYNDLTDKLNGQEIAKTARRPDIRMIIHNNSGEGIQLVNPAGHSDDASTIPSSGDETAAMVILKGDTLEEQEKNAHALMEISDVENGGLNAFNESLKNGDLDDIVAEAYGPAPYEGQVDKLEDLEWKKESGEKISIKTHKSDHCSFGARPPSKEVVLKVNFPITIKGTDTVAENIESGMCIVAFQDWTTGETKTKPIVTSQAKEYYGDQYKNIPEVLVSFSGNVLGYNAPEVDTVKAKPKNGIKPS